MTQTKANPETTHAEAVRLVDEWSKKLESARRRSVDGRTGADIIQEPTKAAEVARSRSQAIEEVRVCEEALEAARGLVMAAAEAWVAQDAAKLAGPIDLARETLEAHNEETARLLEDLQKHTGQAWAPLGRYVPWAPSQGTVSTEATRSAMIALQAQQAALMAAAEGGDPLQFVSLDELPAQLRFDGILPCPSSIEKRERDLAAAADAAAWAALQAELDEASASLGAGVVDAALAADERAGLTAWDLEPDYEYQRPSEEGLKEFERSLHVFRPELGSYALDGITEAQRDAIVTIARIAGEAVAKRILKYLRQDVRP